MSDGDRRIGFLEPQLFDRSETSAALLIVKLFKFLSVYLRSPLRILRYYLPWSLTWGIEKSTFFLYPIAEAIMTFTFTVSPVLSPYWLYHKPRWGPFIVPQPLFPQFPLAAVFPEPDYMFVERPRWAKVLHYMAPFFR